MRYSTWVAVAMAPFALAAPSYDGWKPAPNQDKAVIASYFSALAKSVSLKSLLATVPSCDLSRAVMPTIDPPLPPPAAGLSLRHVAIGRGVQNYTCANETTTPFAVGAVATLYDASCVAASNAQVLAQISPFALQYNLSPDPTRPNPANLMVSGIHYFTAGGVPFFDLDTSKNKMGTIPCGKNASSPAPANAVKGQGGAGDGSVAWLKLTAKDGATGNLMEVYRLNTAGGAAPKTCAGMPAAFSVEYATEYWFWKK